METTVTVNNTTITTNVTDGANLSVTQQSPVSVPVTTTENVLSVSSQSQISMPVSVVESISVIGSNYNFRGNWTTWANVPLTIDGYPADKSGNKKPLEGDFLIVDEANDYTDSNNTTYAGRYLFRYSGEWLYTGKSGWKPEYLIHQNLTSSQIAALNSGITADLVNALKPYVNEDEETVEFSQVRIS